MPKEKILIVEDEVIISDDLRQILTECGYQVIGNVLSGSEAIQVALTDPPDVVIMDIHLQGDLDGIGTALRIQNEATRPVHFVFLSGYPEKASNLEPIQSWVYVKKVWAKQQLVDAIEERNAKLHISLLLAEDRL